jgi:hypothetical protein
MGGAPGIGAEPGMGPPKGGPGIGPVGGGYMPGCGGPGAYWAPGIPCAATVIGVIIRIAVMIENNILSLLAIAALLDVGLRRPGEARTASPSYYGQYNFKMHYNIR